MCGFISKGKDTSSLSSTQDQERTQNKSIYFFQTQDNPLLDFKIKDALKLHYCFKFCRRKPKKARETDPSVKLKNTGQALVKRRVNLNLSHLKGKWRIILSGIKLPPLQMKTEEIGGKKNKKMEIYSVYWGRRR